MSLKSNVQKDPEFSLHLTEVAKDITKRLLSIFEKNVHNERLVNGPYNWFYQREENRELVLFHEYFHGDTLRGLGASHQTGWTALVVNLIATLYIPGPE